MAGHRDWYFRCRRRCAVWVITPPFVISDLGPSSNTSGRYDTGTISGILAMPYWQNLFSTGYRNSDGHLDVTASQSATIVSILSAGTFFGALGAAPVADAIGRRLGLITSSIVFTLGVILQTVATAIPLFLAGRFFAGFGVGLISAMSKSTTTCPYSAHH